MPAVADIGHAVQFYREDAELFDTVGTFLADGIRNGEVSIVIATKDHLRGFDNALVAAGVDLAAARENGLLISFDADAALARLTRTGRLDGAAFSSTFGDVMRRAAETRRPVRACGEMVSLLWDAGDVIGAIELEALCNELRREMRFSMLCTRCQRYAGCTRPSWVTSPTRSPLPPRRAAWSEMCSCNGATSRSCRAGSHSSSAS